MFHPGGGITEVDEHLAGQPVQVHVGLVGQRVAGCDHRDQITLCQGAAPDALRAHARLPAGRRQERFAGSTVSIVHHDR
ncbi:hypothetical protein Misp01_75500 [Microtetraspora sp. NBRC 13810]|nr:hypothetical protein Misp01_75500 [Microtetraspora sp. NBRC 13810]